MCNAMRIHSALVFWLLLVGCGVSEEKASPPESPNVAVAIAFEGSWGWLGNELYETSMTDWRYGAFQHLRVAIEAAISDLPADAEVAIIAYDHIHPRIALPMGPPRERSSVLLGQQRDYEQNIAPDLVSGITVAMRELARSAARRKILVVIGSGNVTNHDTYAADLGELRVRAERAGVETIAIVLPSEYVKDRSATWTDHVVTVRDSWAIVEQLRVVIRSTRGATAVR
jgi:hypothetical protein